MTAPWRRASPHSPDVPVLVVGGGPAGAVTALLLARSGWAVELVDRDRFPRGKACGECLNPAGVLLLERLGLLGAVVHARPVPLQGWELALPGRPAAAGSFAEGEVGFGVERASFDASLLDEARRAGVHVREGVRLVDAAPGGPRHPAWARLRAVDGSEEVREARFLVGADGLHSRVAAAIGAADGSDPPRKASLSWRIRGPGPSRDRGRLVIGHGMTAGLAPVGGGASDLWNATLVVSPVSGPTSRRDPVGPIPEALREEGWETFLRLVRSWRDDPIFPAGGEPVIVAGPWGSGSFRRAVGRPAEGRTLLVGDAAGYFDPLTGQGMFRALRTAKLAAEGVHGHLCAQEGGVLRDTDLQLGRRYARRLRLALGPGRWLQRRIETVVSHDPARQVALEALRRAPSLASALVRLTGDRPWTALPVGSRVSSSFVRSEAATRTP